MPYPYGVAVSPDGAKVYVTSSTSGNMSDIDAATNTVSATITMAGSLGIAVNKAGTRVYSSTYLGVEVIDTATNTVIATIDMPAGTYGIAVNPADTRVYAAHYATDNVSVIDTVTNTVIGTVAVGSHPIGVDINPAGTQAYVVNNGGNTVSVIDIATNTVVSTVAVQTGPTGIGRFIAADSASNTAPSVSLTAPANNATYSVPTNVTLTATAADSDGTVAKVEFYRGTTLIGTVESAPYTYSWNNAPAGSHALTAVAIDNRGTKTTSAVVNITINGPVGPLAYVTNMNDASVSVIDMNTNSVIATVPVGAVPIGVAVNPSGSRAYVVNDDESTVSVIDTTSNTVVATVAVGPYPFGVAVSPDGTKVYVTDITGSISVLDTATNTVTASIPMAGGPGIVVNKTGTRVYSSTYLGVDIVDTATNSVLATIPMPAYTYGMAVNAADTRLFVTNPYDNSVSVIDLVTQTVLTTIPVGYSPLGISVHPDGSKVYAANNGSGTVSVIDTASLNVIATITAGAGSGAIGSFVAGDGVTNVPPTGSLTAPANNATYTVPAPINLTASAADSDGTVAKVEFYQNGVLINITETSPYTFSWPNKVAGTYQLTAVATDNRGARTTSSPITVTVNPPVGPLAVVANSLERTVSGQDTVSVIDTFTHTVLGTIKVDPVPYGVTVDSANNRAYVAHLGNNTVSVIDTAHYTVTGSFPVGMGPVGLAQTPNGALLYVANNNEGTVSVVDTTNGTVVATPSIGYAPYGVAINPAGTVAYVTNSSSGNIAVINTANQSVIATIPLAGSTGVTFNRTGTRAYASVNDQISVIDPVTHTILTQIPVVGASYGLAVNPAGTRLYVAQYYANTVTVIDTVTQAIVATIPTYGNPLGVAINPAGTKVYVTLLATNTVVEIDTATNTVSNTMTVGLGPVSLGPFIGRDNVTNLAPTVAITSPANNASVAPGNVDITASASDPDGTIAKVEFYNGGTLLATMQAPPYTFTWPTVALGSYVLTAKATDNRGTSTTSAPVNLTVAVPAVVYYVHADHLGTPRAITRPSDNAVVWTYENTDPFGANLPNENPSGLGGFQYNLRFLGHYYDAETGTHYNYFRNYDPAIGGYIQSDPIGLNGGVNTYSYVGASPLMFVDPYGLTRLTYLEVADLVARENLSGQSNELIICLIWKESRFDPDAQRTDSTARGLTQMTKPAVKQVQRQWNGFNSTNYENLYNPSDSISIGTAYLNSRIRGAKGDVAKGLKGFGTGKDRYPNSLFNCEKCLKEQNSNQTCSNPAKCLKLAE